MPNTTVPAAGEAMPVYHLEEQKIDCADIAHLISVAFDALTECSFVNADGSRNTQLDEVSTLLRLAREKARLTSLRVDALPSRGAGKACDTRYRATAGAMKDLEEDVIALRLIAGITLNAVEVALETPTQANQSSRTFRLSYTEHDQVLFLVNQTSERAKALNERFNAAYRGETL
jgi:hypothetical protein